MSQNKNCNIYRKLTGLRKQLFAFIKHVLVGVQTTVEPAKDMTPNDANDDLSSKNSGSEDEKVPEKKERQAKPPIEDVRMFFI